MSFQLAIAGAAAMDVRGLQGSLELVAANGSDGSGMTEEGFGFEDELGIPKLGILFGKRDEVSIRAAAGGAAGFGVEQQGEQAEGFRLIGHKSGDEAGEVDGLLGEVAARNIGAGGIAPSLGIGGVDGIKHRVEAGGEFVAAGDAKGDGGLPDLVLGADEALAHGGGRREEGGGDCAGIEAEYGLEH